MNDSPPNSNLEPTLAEDPEDGDIFVVPASFSQKRLWSIGQLDGPSPVYNILSAFKIKGALDAAILEKALNAVVARHESLRTTIDLVDGEPSQLIRESLRIPISITDLLGEPEASRESKGNHIANQEAAYCFDLSEGPLVRASLIRTGTDESIFLLNIHHSISDATSIEIVVRELAHYYNTYSDKLDQPLDDLELQFADFAAWEQEALNGETLKSQIDYWKEKLSGELPVLNVPSDRPRPQQQSHQGSWVPVRIEKSVRDRIQSICAKHKASPFIFHLAAFNILLHRYTQQDDICVGTPSANRNRTELESLAGFFVNTLVFRNQIDSDLSFSTFLGQVRTSSFEAQGNGEVPLDFLVEELRPKRDLSYNPLFQSLFTYQGGPINLELSGLECEMLLLDNGSAKFDFCVTLWETADGGAEGMWEYASDLFDRDTVERMVVHYNTLLSSILENPSLPVSELEMLSPRERQKVLVGFNDTKIDRNRDETIVDKINRAASATPDAVAVVHGSSSVSYRELMLTSDTVAQELTREKIGTGSLVGIYMDRSIETVAAILGVLKSGAAYVPLDPEYPEGRIAFMIEDAQMPCILTRDSLKERLPETQAKTICIDSLKSAGPGPLSPASASDLSYVIYTSGSTGKPKGVAIEHRNVAALIDWALRTFDRPELEGVLFSTSICFDLSAFELFVTLSAGGKVFVAENALELPSMHARDEVTLINTVPSAMAELVSTSSIPQGVRVVNLAGEALSPELVDSIYAIGTIEKVYDLYGPSEDTTYSTWALRLPNAPATIGRPIDNTRAYVLDARMNPVPPGLPGELYLCGEGLARGYLNRPELTSERFVPNPIPEEADTRLYKTGDIVRWKINGFLEYLGRIDHQVKIRGFRIELGEIESVLRSHNDIEDCVVTAQKRDDSLQEIVAYIVIHNDAVFSPPNLRKTIKKKLPDYMVPQHFVELNELPLTPNGKVDRKALPKPNTQSHTIEEYEPPINETEQALCQIWKDILNLESVSRTDNFFDIGGHSLLALRMIEQVNKTLNFRLNARTVILEPLFEIAAQIVENQDSVTTVSPPSKKLGIFSRIFGKGE